MSNVYSIDTLHKHRLTSEIPIPATPSFPYHGPLPLPQYEVAVETTSSIVGVPLAGTLGGKAWR